MLVRMGGHGGPPLTQESHYSETKLALGYYLLAYSVIVSYYPVAPQ